MRAFVDRANRWLVEGVGELKDAEAVAVAQLDEARGVFSSESEGLRDSWSVLRDILSVLRENASVLRENTSVLREYASVLRENVLD